MMSSLNNAVLRTLTYFDTFDYPLNADEVWRWLYPDPSKVKEFWSKEDVMRGIHELEQRKLIERRGAFFFIAGREQIIDLRMERMVANTKLWRRAASTARYLELVPFIRMVAVVNTLAIDNARPESDIDLLIVTSANHIWITRILVSGIVNMLGYRRHGTKIAGRVCLSFYVTTDALDFSSLQSEKPDTHFAMWASQVVPLLNDGTYEKYQAANGWVTAMLPNAWNWEWKSKLLIPNSGLRSIKMFYEIFFQTPIGHWFEAWARSYQLKRIDKHIESKAKLGTTEVVISEDVLKFHEADRRRVYNERFEKRLQEVLSKT